MRKGEMKWSTKTLGDAYWFHNALLDFNQSFYIDDMMMLDMSGNLDAPLP